MKKNKLLYFVSEDWYFCSHRLSLARAAHDSGYDVVVVTRVSEHAREIEEAGLRLIPFEVSRRGINPFRELHCLWKLIKIYRSEQPSLIHNVAIKPALYGTLAARFCRSPQVVNAIAGMGWLFTSNSRSAQMIKMFVRLAFRFLLRPTQLITQNPDDERVLNSLGLDKTRIILGAGVDTKVYKPVDEIDDTPQVVLPGRLLWAKGVGSFVQAARVIKEKGVDAKFILVGDPDPGNPSAVSIEYLSFWQREGVIEWWGKRNNMPAVFGKCHIVCLPTEYGEGIPKSLIEAASCARPIVTTDAPGCREIVKHGHNGLLVPIGNSNALVDALVTLIRDASLRIKMGRRGREMVLKDFLLEAVIDETLQLYQVLLPGSGCVPGQKSGIARVAR